jgi:hypothetical protein
MIDFKRLRSMTCRTGYAKHAPDALLEAQTEMPGESLC